MLGFLRRIAVRAPGIAPPEGSDWPAPRPDGPVCVIGDPHGCLGALERLLETVRARAEGHALVIVGDCVDRGPDSAGVLRLARELAPERTLLGNHEAMMRDFLADPTGRGLRWLRFGGRETLESFGIAPPGEPMEEIEAASDALRGALGPLEGWLGALPRLWRSGDLAVTHAGADPARAIEDQKDGTFVWGHPDFLNEERADGVWVAHGHTVTRTPYASGGRIGLDTGAVFGGPLTAALVAPGEPVAFVSVPGRS